MPETPAIITVSNLIKQFGRFAALRGVDAEFEANKFHVILGDNGAGKTTLLRALAGLAHPTRGTISILGKSPHQACRELGYMAHPSLLYDEMSGLENLRYFARLYEIAGDSRNISHAFALLEATVLAAHGTEPLTPMCVGLYRTGASSWIPVRASPETPADRATHRGRPVARRGGLVPRSCTMGSATCSDPATV